MSPSAAIANGDTSRFPPLIPQQFLMHYENREASRGITALRAETLVASTPFPDQLQVPRIRQLRK